MKDGNIIVISLLDNDYRLVNLLVSLFIAWLPHMVYIAGAFQACMKTAFIEGKGSPYILFPQVLKL